MTEKTFDIIKDYDVYINDDMDECPVRMSSGAPLSSTLPILIVDNVNRHTIIFGEPRNMDYLWHKYHEHHDDFIHNLFDKCYIIVCTDGFIIRCNVMDNDIQIRDDLMNILSNDVNGELTTLDEYLSRHWNQWKHIWFHVKSFLKKIINRLSVEEENL